MTNDELAQSRMFPASASSTRSHSSFVILSGFVIRHIVILTGFVIPDDGTRSLLRGLFHTEDLIGLHMGQGLHAAVRPADGQFRHGVGPPQAEVQPLVVHGHVTTARKSLTQ